MYILHVQSGYGIYLLEYAECVTIMENFLPVNVSKKVSIFIFRLHKVVSLSITTVFAHLR